MNVTDLENALKYLGNLLLDRKQYFEVVAVGGGGLLLIGAILRPTKDLDVVALVEQDELIAATPLPASLSEAIRDVGIALNLAEDWMNTGPEALFKMDLPAGFKSRMQTIFYDGLKLHLAGRFDQICFKLYAAVDQGPESKHFLDLQMLKPTKTELEEARDWCLTQDVSEVFSQELQKAMASLTG